MDILNQLIERLDPQALWENRSLWETSYVVVLILLCWLSLLAARRWIVGGIERLVSRSETNWDDALHDSGLFSRLAPLAPVFVAWYGVALVPLPHEYVGIVIRRVALAVLIVVAVRCVAAFLTAVNVIYSRYPENRDRPIKGYLQVGSIVIHLIAVILVLSVLMDQSPWLFLSGIGALTAVLLLIFRDTLLSLVASISLTGNDMIRVGDWIEMPNYGADGDVIDIALHTVKVQNFDKTITTIPTYQLLNSSFKNWRGMTRAGGRRIKRSLFIDISSIRFLDEGEIHRFENFALLKDYLSEKKDALDAHNLDQGIDPSYRANRRSLTNIGTFRAYVVRYLAQHAQIHQRMTRMVRQLPPGDAGLPIEVYCFTKTTNWGEYEDIQADIFDHLLAMLPEFGLRAFQNPAGSDITTLANLPQASSKTER